MTKGMTKQKPNGIEWLFIRLITGLILAGYTWNVITGCKHRCRWTMPDGTEAICYAERIAHGLARAAYPEGFEHHYYHPERLDAPLKLKEPAGIFLDSMSDLMGHWVPEDQINAVLDVVQRADWHTFFLLTKNAPRLLKFKDQLPPNLWVGVSMPPSQYMGRDLTPEKQYAYMLRALDVLSELTVPVRWMSFEPLSFNVAAVLDTWLMTGRSVHHKLPLEWAVIGAASRGRDYYQPNPYHVTDLLEALDAQHIPAFFKGNLDWSPRREEFPVWPRHEVAPRVSTLPAKLDQLSLF